MPPGSKFFQFHAVFGEIWQNCMLAPSGEVGAPSLGNPGFLNLYLVLFLILINFQKGSGGSGGGECSRAVVDLVEGSVLEQWQI